MFSQIPIGTVNLYNNPLPRRIWQRNVNILSRHADICLSIEMSKNPSKAKAIARRTLLELAPLYQGEAIISLLVEALSPPPSPSDKTSQVTNFPIIMPEFEALSEYRTALREFDINQEIQVVKELLVNQQYTFDLLHYDHDSEKIFWLHMGYGLAEQTEVLNKWKEQSRPAAQQLVSLIKQYYDKDIKSIDVACLDPLLKHSRKDIAVWALTDADQLTGKTGTAQKIAAWREAALEELNVMLNNPTGLNEEKLRQQLTAEIHKIVQSSYQNDFSPELTVLIPK